jgi:hypothetical protein
MNRDVVLVAYAIVLGWCLNSWWREEKERITWNAVQKTLDEQRTVDELRRAQSPEPSAAGVA